MSGTAEGINSHLHQTVLTILILIETRSGEAPQPAQLAAIRAYQFSSPPCNGLRACCEGDSTPPPFHCQTRIQIAVQRQHRLYDCLPQ